MASRVAQPNKVVASVPMVILVDMPTAHATWVPEPSPGQWKMEVTFFCQRACGGECKKDGQGSIGELDMICPSCFINILFCVRTLAVLTLGLGSTCVLFPATWSCTSEEPKTSQNLFPLRPTKWFQPICDLYSLGPLHSFGMSLGGKKPLQTTWF